MTAKEKIYKLKQLNDRSVLTKRIGAYAFRLIQDGSVNDYFFSCPVYRLDGSLIYLGFREQLDGNILYTGYNVEIEFQKNGDLLFKQEKGIFKVSFTNQVFTDVVEGSLIYDNCKVVPTSNGIMVKCIGSSCRIKIETDAEKVIVDKEGTLLLSGRDIDTFAMAVGLFGVKDTKIVPCIPSISKYSGKEFYIELSAINANNFSFEISAYCPKSICDTVIKHVQPDYSGPFAGICYSSKDNEQRLLFRPDNALTRILKSTQNKTIRVYIPRLCGTEIGIKKILNPWCSFRTTWRNCPLYEDKDLEYSIEKNYLIIDLTYEYDKSAVTGYGVMLCGKKEDEQITVSTGDSLYFPYIIEINRREV